MHPTDNWILGTTVSYFQVCHYSWLKCALPKLVASHVIHVWINISQNKTSVLLSTSYATVIGKAFEKISKVLKGNHESSLTRTNSKYAFGVRALMHVDVIVWLRYVFI